MINNLNTCKLNLVLLAKGDAVKRIIVRAIIGAIPGLAMFLLAFPVSGEVELTLGDGGFLVALTGAFAGAIVGASKRRKG